VKRYVPETGSEQLRSLLQSDPVAISTLAMVELASALTRRTREHDLTAEQSLAIMRQFLADLSGFVVLGLTNVITQEATMMLLTSRESLTLRSLDALHLASARWLFDRCRRRGIPVGAFVTADRELIAGARWAGLTPLNPEDGP